MTALALDSANPLDTPPCWIIYGDAASGKTTTSAKAFSEAYWIVTNNGVLRPYADWCMRHWQEANDLGLRTPVKPKVEKPRTTPEDWCFRPWKEGGMAFKVVGKYDQSGRLHDPRDIIDPFIAELLPLIRSGRAPTWGVVFDELSEIMNALYAAARARAPRNRYEPYNVTSEYMQRLCGIARVIKQPVGFVCLATDPDYQGEDDPEPGKLRHPGGPMLPMRKLEKIVPALFDICLRAVVGESGKRQLKTQPDDKWINKTRSFGAEAVEEADFAAHLQRCGYAYRRPIT